MDMTLNTASGLPDPVYEAEFYRDVPVKRLLAWVVDVILIAALVAVLTVLGFLMPLFILPVLWFCVGFVYRWASLARYSATPGMRFAAIELRDRTGAPLDGGTAFLHTAGYTFSVITAPLQLVSVAMMLLTERGQGLTDMILGTAAINRRAR